MAIRTDQDEVAEFGPGLARDVERYGVVALDVTIPVVPVDRSEVEPAYLAREIFVAFQVMGNFLGAQSAISLTGKMPPFQKSPLRCLSIT